MTHESVENRSERPRPSTPARPVQTADPEPRADSHQPASPSAPSYHKIWISSPCDFDCIFCSLRDSQDMSPSKPPGFDTLRAEIEKGRRVGRSILYVTGFEILNYPRLPALLRFARSIGYRRIELQTTGIPFKNRSFASDIVGALGDSCAVYLPLHGATARQHDAITRREGSFKQLMSAIENLSDLIGPHRIRIDSVLCRQNYTDIAATQHLATRLSIAQFVCRIPYPVRESPQDRFDSVAAPLAGMVPYLLSASPALFPDLSYPCVYISHFLREGIPDPFPADVLTFMPYLASEKQERLQPTLSAAALARLGLRTAHPKVRMVPCAHAETCFLADYCPVVIFDRYVKLYGTAEFKCVSPGMVGSFRTRSVRAGGWRKVLQGLMKYTWRSHGPSLLLRERVSPEDRS